MMNYITEAWQFIVSIWPLLAFGAVIISVPTAIVLSVRNDMKREKKERADAEAAVAEALRVEQARSGRFAVIADLLDGSTLSSGLFQPEAELGIGYGEYYTELTTSQAKARNYVSVCFQRGYFVDADGFLHTPMAHIARLRVVLHHIG